MQNRTNANVLQAIHQQSAKHNLFQRSCDHGQSERQQFEPGNPYQVFPHRRKSSADRNEGHSDNRSSEIASSSRPMFTCQETEMDKEVTQPEAQEDG